MRNATTGRATPAALQRGFGAIAAVVVLVVLAVLSAAVLHLGSTAQATGVQNLLAARATQAARAGTEWGLYQAFKGNWTACSSASQTLDLSASTGLRVTVSCDSRSFNEGETTPGTPSVVTIYTIDAVACSGSGDCPDNTAATTPTYIERHLQVQASN